MKSKLLKATLLATAAVALGAFVSPTVAKTYTFTFGTGNGGAYCDGITFTNGGSGDIWSGNLLGSCGDYSAVGGFTIKGQTSTSIELNTTNSEEPGMLETFVIQPKALLWYVYGDTGGGFELLNSGVLTKGAPPKAAPGAKSSVFKNSKAIDKPVL